MKDGNITHATQSPFMGIVVSSNLRSEETLRGKIKEMKRLTLFLALVLAYSIGVAQYKNNIWLVGIDPLKFEFKKIL